MIKGSGSSPPKLNPGSVKVAALESYKSAQDRIKQFHELLIIMNSHLRLLLISKHLTVDQCPAVTRNGHCCIVIVS